MPRDLELAYMAGIFDGEGTINLRWIGASKSLQLKIAAYNTDITILESFPIIFGGKIYTNPDSRRPKYCAMWQCPAPNNKLFCETMLSFCREREKIRKMQVALDYSSLIYNASRAKINQSMLEDRKAFYTSFYQRNDGFMMLQGKPA